MRIIYYFAFLLILLINVASVAGTVEELQSEPAKECSVHEEGITPICKLLGQDCMNEVKQKENETHKKLQKSLTFAKSGLKEKIGESCKEITEKTDNALLDVKTFREWIKSSQNVAALVDILIYLGNLDKPICIALVTLEGLEGSDTEEAKPLNGEENQTHLVSVFEKMATKVKDGTTTTGEEEDDDNNNDLSTVKNDNNDPTSTAFKFGINGVQQLPMSGGHKCADSLDAQEEMATLIQGIVTALKNKKELKEINEDVFTAILGHLKHPGFEKKFDKFVHKLVEKLKEINMKLLAVKAKKGIKKIFIWIFTPTHFEFLIEVLLYLTRLGNPISITRQALATIGLDTLLADYMTKLGAKMIVHGVPVEPVMWAFGPNGVFPLFLRQGDLNSKEIEDYYVDHNGGKYPMDKVRTWSMYITEKETKLENNAHIVEEEIQFVEKIIEEIIKTRQLKMPLHKLMKHVLNNFEQFANHIDQKNKEFKEKFEKNVQEWKSKWEEVIKRMENMDVKELSKKMASKLKKLIIWLITPEHIVNILELVLTITETDVPVYLTLEILEALHITDFILKGLNIAKEKLEKVKFIREHKPATKFVDFMISENGIIPLFLEAGEKSNDRADRVQNESQIMSSILQVFIKGQGSPLKVLWQNLVENIKSKSTLLTVFQNWNALNSKIHENEEYIKIYAQLKAKNNWKKVRKNLKNLINLDKAEQEEMARKNQQAKTNWKKVHTNLKALINLDKAEKEETARKNQQDVQGGCGCFWPIMVIARMFKKLRDGKMTIEYKPKMDGNPKGMDKGKVPNGHGHYLLGGKMAIEYKPEMDGKPKGMEKEKVPNGHGHYMLGSKRNAIAPSTTP